MKKIFLSLMLLSLIISSCGSPNSPENLTQNDGGYKIVGKYKTAGNANDVIVKDSLAYLVQGEGGLVVLNIRNKTNPQLVTTISDEIRGYSAKIDSKDNGIYIASGTFGVTAVDITDSNNPQVTGESYVQIKPARDFHIMNDYLFVSLSEVEVKVAKIEDEGRILDFRGGIDVPGYSRGLTTSSDQKYLLVACGEMGLSIINIEGLDGFSDHSLSGWIDTEGYAEDVVVNPTQSIAYVASGTSGLAIVDYSDTTNINIVGKFSTNGYAKELIYQNDLLFVTTENRGLQILDVSNSTAPKLIGIVDSKDARGVLQMKITFMLPTKKKV
jgi:hypothetical protein